MACGAGRVSGWNEDHLAAFGPVGREMKETVATGDVDATDLFADTGDASPAVGFRDRRFTLQRVDGPVDQDSRLVASHPAAADAREMPSLLALPTPSAIRLFSLLDFPRFGRDSS